MITGSKTLLFLACPPWSLLPAPRESSALSEEGQDVHAFVQAVAERFAVLASREGLWEMSESLEGLLATAQYEALVGVPERSRARCESLDLSPLAPFLRPGAFRCEVGIAYNPVTGEARRLPDAATREERYSSVDPWVEIAMSLDFNGNGEDSTVVADLKGRRPDLQDAHDQMRTYCLAASRLHGKSRAIYYLMPCGDEETRVLGPFEMDAAALEIHAMELREAWRRRQVAAEALAFDRSLLPDPRPAQLIGYLHLGPHCERCPARFACPARQGQLVAALREFDRGDLLDAGGPGPIVLTPETAALALARIRQVESVLEPVKEEIKALARRCGGIPLPNGEVYGARGETDSLDVDGALSAIAALDAEMLSDVEASVTPSLTMGAVMDAAGKHRRPGETVGAARKRVREALEAARCIRKKVVVKAGKGPCLSPEEEP